MKYNYHRRSQGGPLRRRGVRLWTAVAATSSLLVVGLTTPAAASPVRHTSKPVCPASSGKLGISQRPTHLAPVAKPGSVIACMVQPSAADRARTLATFNRMHAARNSRQSATRTQATDPLLPHPIPAWCSTNTVSTPWHDLTEGCFEAAGVLELINVDTGEVFGTVSLGYAIDEYLDSTTSTDWDVEVSMSATAEDPPGVAESMTIIGDTAITRCAGGGAATGVLCHETLLDFPEQPIALGDTAEGYASFDTSPIPQGNSDSIISTLGWHFITGIPGVFGDGEAGNSFYTVCDNALPGYAVAGCRADPSSLIPTFVLSQGSHNDGTVARHIVGSIAGGSVANNLQRTGDDSITNANRAKACPFSFPRPTGYTCDEYPFASTIQGGSNYPNVSPFTLSFCQIPTITARSGNYSACMVPEAQNNYAGNALKNFYNLSRILPREATRLYDAPQFDVHMIP